MSIPKEAWNAASHGNWQNDEETIHRILEKALVAHGVVYCWTRTSTGGGGSPMTVMSGVRSRR
jgi:hypothetical protein